MYFSVFSRKSLLFSHYHPPELRDRKFKEPKLFTKHFHEGEVYPHHYNRKSLKENHGIFTGFKWNMDHLNIYILETPC